MRWYASATWPVSAYRWWMAYISGPFRLDEVLAAVDRDGGPGEESVSRDRQCRGRDVLDSLIGTSSLMLGRMSAHRTIRWIFREPYARSPQT